MNKIRESEVDYSVVIPVYYNEGLLTETMNTIKNDVIARNPDLSCEVIFVDDGSGDGSFGELLKIYEENIKTVKVIKLTRNFGQVNALHAGFSYAHGKCIIAISADGQDPPVLINDMLKAYFQEHFEIVACERQSRDESLYRSLTSKIFYAMIKKLSFQNMPIGGFDFILLGRRVIDILIKNREAHSFLQGQILWTGFKTKFIKYERKKRKMGTSRWTFGKKLTYLIDGVMSYSFFPIRLISLIGIIFAFLGFFYAIFIFFFKIIGGIPIKGWAPIMIILLVVAGIQMLMLGIIGEYLWRTLAQVRYRDPFIIEAIYDDSKSTDMDAA
jgi:dolichol-phosphate mannosyltransferase